MASICPRPWDVGTGSKTELNAPKPVCMAVCRVFPEIDTSAKAFLRCAHRSHCHQLGSIGISEGSKRTLSPGDQVIRYMINQSSMSSESVHFANVNAPGSFLTFTHGFALLLPRSRGPASSIRSMTTDLISPDCCIQYCSI